MYIDCWFIWLEHSGSKFVFSLIVTVCKPTLRSGEVRKIIQCYLIVLTRVCHLSKKNLFFVNSVFISIKNKKRNYVETLTALWIYYLFLKYPVSIKIITTFSSFKKYCKLRFLLDIISYDSTGRIEFSLGLISDSFHMFFDCTGLLAGLVATVITKVRFL